jgi:hypothetical protein
MKTKRVTTSKADKPMGTKASRGGRPIKDAKLVCSEKLTLYLTPPEMIMLTGNHDNARRGVKLSLNEFAKQQLFSRRKVAVTATSSLNQYQLKKLNELVSELRHIGVNYNQSVKRLNQYHFPEQLHGEFEKNARLAGEILTLIQQAKQLFESLEKSTPL